MYNSPGRYKQTLVAGTTDTYDLEAVPGVVTEAGDDLNKANLLPDAVVTALGLNPADNPQVKDALYALSQKTQPAELHVLVGSGVTVTATLGTRSLSATAGSDGWAILYPAAFGNWTLSATISGSTVTKTFTIDAMRSTILLATLESLSWPVVASVSETGMASKLWSVGDTKTLTVNRCYLYCGHSRFQS